MRTLKTREAANLLNVSPNTLRTWERKFGYPRPSRSAGRHRSYAYAEIVALRDALKSGLSVPSAISAVREGIGGDALTLARSLDSFDLDGADRAMEASFALRSLERSVEELLLPALDEIRRRDGASSTTWAVANRWAIDWLARAQRLSPAVVAGPGVLIGDASGGDLGSATSRVRALELFCRRGGLDILLLPVAALTGLREALSSIDAVCVVVAGSYASDDAVARWAYAVQSVTGTLPIALYLRTSKGDAAHVLPAATIEAQRRLVRLATAARGAKPAASGGEANRLAQSS